MTSKTAHNAGNMDVHCTKMVDCIIDAIEQCIKGPMERYNVTDGDNIHGGSVFHSQYSREDNTSMPS